AGHGGVGGLLGHPLPVGVVGEGGDPRRQVDRDHPSRGVPVVQRAEGAGLLFGAVAGQVIRVGGADVVGNCEREPVGGGVGVGRGGGPVLREDLVARRVVGMRDVVGGVGRPARGDFADELVGLVVRPGGAGAVGLPLASAVVGLVVGVGEAGDEPAGAQHVADGQQVAGGVVALRGDRLAGVHPLHEAVQAVVAHRGGLERGRGDAGLAAGGVPGVGEQALAVGAHRDAAVVGVVAVGDDL